MLGVRHRLRPGHVVDGVGDGGVIVVVVDVAAAKPMPPRAVGAGPEMPAIFRAAISVLDGRP